MARKAGKSKGQGRAAQLRAAYQISKQSDPRIGWIVFGTGFGIFAVLLAIGFLIGQPVTFGIFAVLTGVLVGMIVFGRRAEKAAFSQVEGQPGAAAAVMNSLRRGWTVTPAVAATRNQDVIHRAVGRPGIVLVAEGAPTRVSQLLAAEKRKMGRFAPDAPIYDIVIGNGEGQVPLRKLHRTLIKLPRNLKPASVTEINHRLRAVGGANIPIPKGPLPKGMKIPKDPGGGIR